MLRSLKAGFYLVDSRIKEVLAGPFNRRFEVQAALSAFDPKSTVIVESTSDELVWGM